MAISLGFDVVGGDNVDFSNKIGIEINIKKSYQNTNYKTKGILCKQINWQRKTKERNLVRLAGKKTFISCTTDLANFFKMPTSGIR